MSDRDAIWRFAEHVAGTDYEDLPESAAVATRTFLLDTLGVGVAGSAGPWTRRLIETQRLSCPGDHARVWSHGTRLSATGAAVCNAYQIHNAEFDCVHEGAVVYTFTVPVAAALAWAEREGGVGGRDFLIALASGWTSHAISGLRRRARCGSSGPPQPGRSARSRPSAASPDSTPRLSSTRSEPSSASSREPCRLTSRARPCSGCKLDSARVTRSSPATWRHVDLAPIGTGAVRYAAEEWAEARHILYVPGNHEFYGTDIARARNQLTEECYSLGITLLDPDAIVIDDVHFIGATLWTDFLLDGIARESVAHRAALGISDFDGWIRQQRGT